MRIGCVPYGHARPFAGGWVGREIFWDHPRGLVEGLRAGRLDLALVPVWEVLTGAGYRVMPDFAVGSSGEVRSVGVFHERPLASSHAPLHDLRPALESPLRRTARRLSP